MTMSNWGRDWKKSDAAFLAWLRNQPSCLSGQFSEYVHGIGRNPACHVRSASNSGTGYKPQFSAVSLTQKEHSIQHTKGETSLLEMHFGRKFTALEAHEFFASKAREAYDKWVKASKS